MKRSTTLFLGSLALLACAVGAREGSAAWGKKAGAAGAKPDASGDPRRSITVGGMKREYIVHLPQGYDGRSPLPLVINFHGGGGRAEDQVALTNMNATADKDGFMVVYPEGSGRFQRFLTFDAGVCCGFARDNKVDDVRFTSAMIDDLESAYRIDANRIYATGHSNGAMMAHRLGCALSDRIAAIAPVSGPLGIDSCTPDRPVPVLHFHGTADLCAPFNGGAAKVPGAGEFPSIPGTINGWVKRDGCPSETHETYKKGNVTCTTHGPCTGGAEVTLCLVDGGGHAWPGGTSYPSKGFCGGIQTQDISANDAMWEFFKRHPLHGGGSR